MVLIWRHLCIDIGPPLKPEGGAGKWPAVRCYLTADLTLLTEGMGEIVNTIKPIMVSSPDPGDNGGVNRVGYNDHRAGATRGLVISAGRGGSSGQYYASLDNGS